MQMFQEVAVAESQKLKEENKDASAAAGLLEKLSVDEKKTEDKAGEEIKETEDTEKADDEKKDGEVASSA